jgi:hypothetical protein
MAEEVRYDLGALRKTARSSGMLYIYTIVSLAQRCVVDVPRCVQGSDCSEGRVIETAENCTSKRIECRGDMDSLDGDFLDLIGRQARELDISK